MRCIDFAKEIVDFAKEIKPDEKWLLKGKIDTIRNKCENNKEYILSMGYAIHFADSPSTPLLFAPIFMAMGINGVSENAKAVFLNAKSINTLRPHVKKMIVDAHRDQDLETLTKDLMCAVYHSSTPAKQDLILNMTRAMIDDLSKKDNVLDTNATKDNSTEMGL